MLVETIFWGLPCRRSLTPRVSPSHEPVLSFTHYFQAPAAQRMKNQTFRSEVRGISRSATNLSGIYFVQDKHLDGEKIYLVILSYLGWLEEFIAFFSAFND